VPYPHGDRESVIYLDVTPVPERLERNMEIVEMILTSSELNLYLLVNSLSLGK